MNRPYILYAWDLSLYSGKARAYLRYKDIPYVERKINLWSFRKIEKKVGARVMPVVVTPHGEWLQDTSNIIDTLERLFPARSVIPHSPRQRVAAYLLEAWGDEFWLPTAMHYRWSFPENFEHRFKAEGGNDLLPIGPRCLKNRLVAAVAAQMRRYLPGLGVVSSQRPVIEAWTAVMLDALDVHFAKFPYLLGSRPCIGDFGLIGPLYAHLGTDPYPARELIASRPHLQSWIWRMHQPQKPSTGDFLAADHLPDTLTPVFRSIFSEFWAQLRATQQEVQKLLPQLRPHQRLPRLLGGIEIPMGPARLRIAARSYSLWMAQRALDAYAALPEGGRASVERWLDEVGGREALQLRNAPRLERVGLHVRPAA